MRVLDMDVLVVGAGGAGMRAAIEADSVGARVTLIDKSIIGKGGATVTALCQVCAALGFSEEDSWEIHFDDTMKAGKLVNNPELVEILAREAPARLLELERYGLRFDREPDGAIRQIAGPGHSRKRAAFVNLHTGEAMIAALLKELRRHPRIRRLNDLMLTRILVGDGRVVGAVGLDVREGAHVAFRSPTVILATGGGSWMYSRSTGGPNLTGDGYALAYRAGAEMVDMEFPQFLPSATLHPRLPGISVALSAALRYRTGGTMYNSLGEDFLPRYTGSEGMGTRDAQSLAIMQEVKAGRGSPHGGVYSDLSGPGAEVLEREYGPKYLERIRRAGADIRSEPIEVAPTCHFFMGGVRINGRCESSLPGLYAAGEAAGGVHGANRITGNALAEIFVFGARAGKFAGEHGQSAAVPEFPKEQVEAEVERLDSMRRAKPGSAGPLEVRRRLGALLWEHLGPLRSAEGILRAQREMERVRDTVMPDVGIADEGRVFNREWVEVLEAEFMLDVATMIAHAASIRTESRGAHFREDYPSTDPDWEKNIIIWREAGEMRHKLVVATDSETEAGQA